MTVLHSDASRADFLKAVPIFAGLSERLREEVAARSAWTHLPAGEWLFRQGDEGDSLYIVRSGRLEIVLDGLEREVVRLLTRGAVVGELALITGAPRSASVRARRDSELLRLDRESFAALLQEEPEFAVTLTRELGHQLQLSRGLSLPKEAPLATITVVPLEPDLPVERFTQGVIAELSRFGSVVRLDEAEGLSPSDYAELLDRCELEHDHVVLVAGLADKPTAWTQFCIRQADRTVALAGGGPPRPSIEQARLRGSDVIFLRPPGAVLEAWDRAVAPRSVRVLGQGGAFDSSVAAVGRRLGSRAVGVVLSGGGARGFAHIGVLEQLLEAGTVIDRVGGCSMGAFVGAMFAMGLPIPAIRRRCIEELVERKPMADYTVPVVSLIRGQRGEAMLRRTFGETRIEELERDYFCSSCDLITGRLVVHRRGPVFEAVGPSMSLPGVFPPVSIDGRLLVDGGVLDNLPVGPMADAMEGPVIAVDVTAEFRLPSPGAAPQNLRARWSARARSKVARDDSPLPRLKETLVRSIAIGSVDAVAAARRSANLLIAPQTGSVGLLEFGAIDRMIDAGRQAAREALAQSPALASR